MRRILSTYVSATIQGHTASIMLRIVVVVAWLSEIKVVDTVQVVISSLTSLAYIFAAPVGLRSKIKPEVLPLAMAITVFYDKNFLIKTHGTRVLMAVIALITMHLHGPASSAPVTFAFCIGAVCDASLRKNMTMFAVLVFWLTIALTLASTQFLRRPAALKIALPQIRAAHGPVYVLTLAQAYAG